jgi:type II secretory ATPase GspE/PulE/Tfp pilus assembly ATPase PilB-like protein
MRTDTDPLQPAIGDQELSREEDTRPLLHLSGEGREMLGPLLDVAAARGLVRLVLDVRCDAFEVLGQTNPSRREPPVRLFRDKQGGSGGRDLLAYVQELAGMRTERPSQPVTGTFRFAVGGTPRDFEVVVVPALRGEQAAIEMCPTGVSARALDELGFVAGDLARVRAMLAAPSGFIALVGDPGNGKTTLYRAIIDEVAADGRRVISVEHSVEAPRDDIVVVRRPEGDALPHEAWVDAALRLGPSMAGFDDLPGRAACARAVRGGLENVLIVYALALADVPSAARYLDDLPLRPGFVPAALHGVIAVRLVREACQICSKKVPLPLELTAAVATAQEGAEAADGWCQGAGCQSCSNTGTSRLRTLFEVGALEEDARRRLIEGPGSGDLATLLSASRVDSIRAQAVRLAAEGVIPVSELNHVL